VSNVPAQRRFDAQHEAGHPFAEVTLNRFKQFFGQRGGDQVPGNIGTAREIVGLCREVLQNPDPVLFDYYSAWRDRADTDGPQATPLGTATKLKQLGMLEAAWDVIQLHFDQMQKREAVTSARLHKGDPACGIAIMGQYFGSHALIRHYAQLSSAGDVYWEQRDLKLVHGGLGPLIMEPYETSEKHNRWRQQMREILAGIPEQEPRYLEAFLLMRWFGEAHWDLFLGSSRVLGNDGRPFIEVLSDLVELPGTNQKGKLFEGATALLFSTTPGFEVRSARRTTDEQVDVVVRYERDPLTILPLEPGPGLVECKSSADPVTVSELRDFGSKCQFHRVKFGVMVTLSNITGRRRDIFVDPQHAELVRRRFLVDGLTILVIDISSFRHRARDLRGLQEALTADHDNLIFGPIDGERK
jgi:hypothetical protein